LLGQTPPEAEGVSQQKRISILQVCPLAGGGAERQDKTSFVGQLQRGRTDGPKPGTATWDGKIVETWEPDKEE